jgi:hypothetical protein
MIATPGSSKSDRDLWADEVHARVYGIWFFAPFSMTDAVVSEGAQVCVVLHTSATMVRRFVFL